jgi:PKD repeat protein
MKKLLTLLVIFTLFYMGPAIGQNTSCIDSELICTGQSYTYSAGTTGNAEPGAYYGCLQTQPAPAWFHMNIDTAGSISIYMFSNPLVDIDFICWGPFGDPFSPCLEGLTAGKVVDCSYSPNPTEYCDIPDGQSGQYYILLITNYSRQPAYITFEQTSGSGSMGCDVTYIPIADFSASPLEGETPLSVQFTDQSTQNPIIWNWDFQNDGVFDAFVQNPSFSYYEPGNYSVRLVVENAIAADTMIKENYITVYQGSTGGGLVADYPFNGNASDISGYENHGTVYGAMMTTDRFDNPDAAYNFNGIDQYIEVSPSSSLNTAEMSGFSVSLWGKLNLVDDEETFLNVNNKSDGNDFDIRPQNGKITFINNGGGLFLQDIQEVATNEWYHIAVVLDYSTDSAFLYINGQLAAADTTEFVLPTGPYFSFGKHTLNSWYFNGVLDDIKIYNRVLSVEEIGGLYNINGLPIPDICVVSVTNDDYNQIVWNNQFSTRIDFYNICRESTQANVFELIGSVPYGDQGLFNDTNSFPQQRPYKYRMTGILDDGTATDSSSIHKTIHLTINQGPSGWNLIWSPYEGFLFNTYYIYRGSSPDSLSLLDSISSSFNSFTDINPPLGPFYYAVGIVKEEGCFPARDNDYNRSVSNVQFNGATGIIDIHDAGIILFPNPADEILNIQLKPMMDYPEPELSIYDLQGKVLLFLRLNSAKTSVSIKDIKPGIYFVRLKCQDAVLVKKLVKF